MIMVGYLLWIGDFGLRCSGYCNIEKEKEKLMLIARNVVVHERHILRVVHQSGHGSDIHNLVDNEILSCSAISKFV